MAVNLPFSEYFEGIRSFAAQSLLNRVLAYGFGFIVSAVLATILATIFAIPASAPFLLSITALFFALFLMYVDPEGEYTKEDALAVFVLAAVMPGIAYLILQMGQGMVAQIAAPLVMLQETASQVGTAVASGTSGIVWNFGQYLGMFLLYAGALGISFGIKEVAVS